MNPPLTAPAGTRDRILAHLEENRTTSVVALSRAWGLTRADIRYHLNTLIQEGLVERVTDEQTGTREQSKAAARGRPTAFYRLSARSTPDNFAQLAAALLIALHGTLPEGDRDEMLREIAGSLAGEPQTDSRLTSVRLHQAVETLNRQAYRARWEASPAGPRFLLRSCPYAAKIDQHPELCRMDLFLLERLAGIPLAQAAQMGRTSGKPPACVFVPR